MLRKPGDCTLFYLERTVKGNGDEFYNDLIEESSEEEDIIALIIATMMSVMTILLLYLLKV